jgi:formylglycine-generating enzyme required for sulfatase activity
VQIYSGLSITGAIGASLQIQYTSNSAQTNAWSALTNFSLTSSPQLWVDTTFPATSGRAYRVVTNSTPQNMALVPAGAFAMGDAFAEGNADELPVHTVYLNAFYIDKFDVTKTLWNTVLSSVSGYSFDNGGFSKTDGHPLVNINWFDAVKWCNERSEMEGLTPCYYTDAGLTTVYRMGQTNPFVKWDANGYRLPTEAEWEKAARGGTAGHRFAWSDLDTISEYRANYISTGGSSYDLGPYTTFNTNFNDGVFPYTSPVGYFAPNSFGLYDMTGNVWNWCWDWYGSSWYGDPGATQNDVRGPASGAHRVIRGGSWTYTANYVRCAVRDPMSVNGGFDPTQTSGDIGFRCVRSLAATAGGAQTNPGLNVQVYAGLSITGAIGSSLQIQCTTNLARTNAWSTLATNLTSSPQLWVDTNRPATGRRFYRVVATPATSQNMVLVPAGTFTMGDTFAEGNADELPVHSVYVSAFYMEKLDVTKTLWGTVLSSSSGYNFDNGGYSKTNGHPLAHINWFDAVKWCNERSEMEGLTPCYYADAGLTIAYRTGQTNPFVKWDANGYRLPTEAEWEKAARGGATGQRFPWSDVNTISEYRANYLSPGPSSYDLGPYTTYNAAFNDGVPPYTGPVGYFAPNGFGLYDMAGNVWNWCWDWYGSSWYSDPGATQNDVRGPASGVSRLIRGGSWNYTANYVRCAVRDNQGYGGYDPTQVNVDIGFRCVRAR